MSRVANNPIVIPPTISVEVSGSIVSMKGAKAILRQEVHPCVKVVADGNFIKITTNADGENSNALAGTARALLNNMILGLSGGFKKKLILVGVGYKAQVQDRKLVLALGHSHPINYIFPDNIAIETPSPTEIVVNGNDKQLVGKTAAEIRSFRPPEPYKGKGVRYEDEIIVRKEGKKK